MADVLERLVVESTVRWQTVFGTIVAKSLVWWVWELLGLRRNAYPTLMPPEGLLVFDPTSEVAIARRSYGSFEEELLQWRMLFCVTIGASIVTCIWKKAKKETADSRAVAALAADLRPRVPNRRRKGLEIRTSGAIGEDFPRIAALRQGVLAMSPIQEVAGPSSARLCAAAACTTPALFPGVTHIQPLSAKMTSKLAFSGVILTIDISPSVPEQADDKVIVELSEMLQRW
ncbi:hypothetical protein SVAN01_06337 [Stagonosporopsis vannaccii]|nr:hypothetical protein SVAN01_06337 [Stagonosporopsis vannaccii]